MFRPPSAWIALRYLGAQRANQFAALVAFASVIGVALGVAALIVVLSVMNGFENELRGRLTSLTGHGSILTGPSRHDWTDIEADVRRYPGVQSAVPYVEVEAMVAHGGELAGAVIEGIDPEVDDEVSGVRATILAGDLDDLQPGSWRALVGRALAARLGLRAGDPLRVMVPVRDERGRISSRLRQFTVAGFFEIGVKDHDGVRILVNLADGAALAGMSGRVSGIRLRVQDIFAAPLIVQGWAERWEASGRDLPATSDWTRENATYFRAVRIEKTMMTLLLSLIVAVAAFNIVATLVMVVTDKRSGIAILRTLGFSRRSVVAMFALQGVLVGWIGVVAGVVGGVLLARNVGTVAPALERLFGFQFMPADVYYLTALPSDLQWSDVAWISALALALTACATLYPAFRAAAVAPAEVLRYE